MLRCAQHDMPQYAAHRAKTWTYLKSRQGSKDAGHLYVRDFQRGLAGVCELEFAGIRRAQADMAQIADRLLERNPG